MKDHALFLAMSHPYAREADNIAKEARGRSEILVFRLYNKSIFVAFWDYSDVTDLIGGIARLGLPQDHFINCAQK